MKLKSAAYRSPLVMWVALMLSAPWALVLVPVQTAQAGAPDCPAPRAMQAGPHRVRGLATSARVALAAAAPLACPVDLTAYWKLDEASGPPYVDSANGHDGTCTAGECPAPTAGVVNSAQVFSSTTSVNVPAHADFNWGVDDSFSIEYWMQTPSDSTCSGNQVVLGRDVVSGPDTQLHWWTGCFNGGTAAFYARDLAGNQFSLLGTTDLTDGAWHHVVAVRDADADELRLYVDGALQASVAATYAQGFGTATTPINLGWLLAGNIYHFSGAIDELAVYGRALSETEVGQHRTANLAGTGICDTVIPPPQHILYMPLIMG